MKLTGEMKKTLDLGPWPTQQEGTSLVLVGPFHRPQHPLFKQPRYIHTRVTMVQVRSLSNVVFCMAATLCLLLVMLWYTVGEEDFLTLWGPSNTDGAAERPHYRPSLDSNHDKHNKGNGSTTRTPAPVATSGSRQRTHLITPTVSPVVATTTTVAPTVSPVAIPSRATLPRRNSSTPAAALLLQDFHFCRTSQVTADRDDDDNNGPTTALSNNPQQLQQQHQDTLDIWYQCQGKDYETFGNQLEQLVMQQAAAADRTWGRRPTALPAGKTVLLWGNSHLRQIAHAWTCQYATQIVQLQHYGDAMDPHMVLKVEFTNQATLLVVANSYAPYTDDWLSTLEQQLQMPSLSTAVDAVVLGMFNKCTTTGNSNFAAHMLALMGNRTDLQACVAKNDDNDDDDASATKGNKAGPNITDIAQVFAHQPILYIPMFSLSRRGQICQTLVQIDKLKDKRHDNVTSLPVRRYIDLMQNECGSNSRLEVTKCRNNAKAKENMHRCMGPWGGHPDLIAWDAAEFMFAHLTAASDEDDTTQEAE